MFTKLADFWRKRRSYLQLKRRLKGWAVIDL